MNCEPTTKGQWLSRVRADPGLALLALLFLVLPIYRTGILENSFITPKVFVLLLFELPLLGLLLHRVIRKRASAPPRAMTVLFIALAALNGTGILYARSWSLALLETGYFVSFILLYFILEACLTGARDCWIVIHAGIVAAVATAVWTILEDITRGRLFGELVPLLPDWRGHLAAGLGNSGHIAGFIGLFLPAAIVLFLSAQRLRLCLLAGILLMFAALVVTWSVGSTSSTIASLILWCAIAGFAGLFPALRWKRMAALIGVGLIASGFYLLPHPLNPHAPSLLKEAFGSERWAEGWPTRVVIWKTTLHMIKEHPLLGIGSGNFTLEYVRQIVPDVISNPHLRVYAGAFTNDAHNEYLHLWCEGGIATLAVFLALVVRFFHTLALQLRRRTLVEERLLLIACGAGVTTFLLDALMTFPIRLPAHFASLMFFFALPNVMARQASVTGSLPESPGTTARMPLLPVGAAAILFLLWLGTTIVYGRRIVAEYFQKQARSIAEMPTLALGQPTPTWSTAERFFQDGIKSLAEGSEPRFRKGLAAAAQLLSGEGTRLAEEMFRQSLRWDPNYSNASSRLGSLCLMTGRYKEAVQVLRDTTRNLESPEIRERLGLAYYLDGNRAAAGEQWEICRARRPQFAEHFNGLLRQAGKAGE